MSWVWVLPDALASIHSEQLAEHGGADGFRDKRLLESALARPENLAAYGAPDVFELAAAYSFGVIRNHPFVDGNKRAGFIAGAMFLELNGYAFSASDIEVVEMTLKAAAGEVSEEEFSCWLKANSNSSESS